MLSAFVRFYHIHRHRFERPPTGRTLVSDTLGSAFATAVTILLVAADPSGAQSTGDPIPTSARVASWTLVLGDVVQIPDSEGSAPRLEQVVANNATGLAYVIDQRGWIYAFDPNASTPVAWLVIDLVGAVGSLET